MKNILKFHSFLKSPFHQRKHTSRSRNIIPYVLELVSQSRVISYSATRNILESTPPRVSKPALQSSPLSRPTARSISPHKTPFPTEQLSPMQCRSRNAARRRQGTGLIDTAPDPPAKSTISSAHRAGTVSLLHNEHSALRVYTA